MDRVAGPSRPRGAPESFSIYALKTGAGTSLWQYRRLRTAALARGIISPHPSERGPPSASEYEDNEASSYSPERVEALFRENQRSTAAQLDELRRHIQDYESSLKKAKFWWWTKSGVVFLAVFYIVAYLTSRSPLARLLLPTLRQHLDLIVSTPIAGFMGLAHHWRITELKVAGARVDKIREAVARGAKVSSEDGKWIGKRNWKGVDWEGYKPKSSSRDLRPIKA